jgi:hypothetical protein
MGRARSSRCSLRPAPRDFCFLLSQFQLFSTPPPALAAETLKLERPLSDLVNQAYALTPVEIALMWQTASLRMPFPFLGDAGMESTKGTSALDNTPCRD